MASGSAGPRFWARSALAVGARPRLWPTAIAQCGRLARARWWRRPPFLPLPEAGYLAFRLRTQYGDGGVPEPDDVVTYLEWCAAMARNRRRAASTRR